MEKKNDSAKCELNGQAERAWPDSENKLVSVGPGGPDAKPQLTQIHIPQVTSHLFISAARFAVLNLFHLRPDSPSKC